MDTMDLPKITLVFGLGGKDLILLDYATVEIDKGKVVIRITKHGPMAPGGILIGVRDYWWENWEKAYIGTVTNGASVIMTVDQFYCFLAEHTWEL